MAFCSSCGAQLGDGERFCRKCGADQTANAGGAPDAIPQPVGAPPLAAPPQMPFVAPAQIPMSVAMPPQVPARKSGMMWLGIIIVAAGGYYYYTHYMHPQGQTPGNPPQSQPAPQNQPGPQSQPGPQGQTPPQGQPGIPGQQPGAPGQQPASYPGQQPGGQGQPGGNNQALVQQQQFAWKGAPEGGYAEITQAAWKNGSNVTIQSATLDCVEFNANNQAIAQMQTTLNGPAAPGQILTFSQIRMGQLAQGVSQVKCRIVAVVPAG